MKKIIVPLLLVVLICACEDEPEVVITPDVTSEVRSNLSTARWRVTSFINGGLDLTPSFHPFLFEFESSGVMTGEDGHFTYFGEWNASRDPEQSNTMDKVDINLLFPTPEAFAAFNKTWRISTMDNSNFILASSDGDELTFTKH